MAIFGSFQGGIKKCRKNPWPRSAEQSSPVGIKFAEWGRLVAGQAFYQRPVKNKQGQFSAFFFWRQLIIYQGILIQNSNSNCGLTHQFPISCIHNCWAFYAGTTFHLTLSWISTVFLGKRKFNWINWINWTPFNWISEVFWGDEMYEKSLA